MRDYLKFLGRVVRISFRGGWKFFAWMTLLTLLCLVGLNAYARQSFSAAQARTPDTCGQCHMGPDHSQLEIFNESKHGIAYYANVDKMKLDNPKWIVGEDYTAAPTCATCHIYTHWHVTYEVARNFYTEYVPELQDLVDHNLESADPVKKAAAENLAKMLDDTLNNSNHRWFLNKVDPEEKALREKQRQDFLNRYNK